MSPSNNVVNIQVQPTENKPKMQCCQNIQPSHGFAATPPPPFPQSSPSSFPAPLPSSQLLQPTTPQPLPSENRLPQGTVWCGRDEPQLQGCDPNSAPTCTCLPHPAPSSRLPQVNISPYKKKSPRGVAPQAEPLSLGYCRTAGISYHFRFHYCRCADMSQKCLNI